MFAKHMKMAGLSRDDFVFMNAVQCGYDKDRFRSKDKRIIEQACREFVVRKIEEMRPEVVIALGAEAAKAVEGRAVKITKSRGVLKYNESYDTYTYAVLDPTYVYIHPEHEPLFASDCRQFKRLVDNDYDVAASGEDVLGEYEIVYDLQFLIDQKPTELSYDLETLGLDSRAPEAAIMTIHLCAEEGKAYMVPWMHPESEIRNDGRAKRKIKRQLAKLLQNSNVKVVGQNNKFDAIWTYQHLGFRYRIDEDTLMLAAEIDENALDKSQDTLTKLYVPEMAGYADAFNSEFDKSRMDLIPLNRILDYGCGDTDANLRIFHVLEPIIKRDKKLYQHYRKVAMPGINAFVPIEINGQHVNEDALDEFEEVLSEYVDDLRKKLLRQVPRSIKRKHIEKGISLGRSDFLIDILFKHDDGFRLEPKVFTKTTQRLDPEFQVPSTSSKDHLPYFFTHPEVGQFCMDLADWMKTDRLLGTNVRKFRENYIKDGKIYPGFSLWTAVTGRTSSYAPNSQNYPKRGKQAKAYRKIFVPPPGYVLLEADLSQAELRIAADMSNDMTMLNIYRNNGDIHRTTATVVMGVSMEEFLRLPPEEQSLARFKAKAVNFGFLYGMWWRKFIVYAKTQYGVEFTEEEAKRIREGFFELYCSLPHWHEAMVRLCRQYGFVRSYSGKVRHLPMIWSEDESISREAGRQAINSPVQNFASDLGVMAMSRITNEVNPEYLQVTGFVHDALYAYVPEKYVEWGAKTLKHYMETNPLEEWFGLKLKLPIVADVGFGWNGGETYEMSGLSLDERFDFNQLSWDEEKQEHRFRLPRQRIPANNGRHMLPEHLRLFDS
jgi:uracil-DNA glycosylase family 4